MKKKIKMFDTKVVVGKLIAAPLEMEVEIYYDEMEKVDAVNSSLRMSAIPDSIVDKTNPLKPRKINKDYVSRINCKTVFEIKDDGLYRDGKLIKTETLEVGARIIYPEDIN